MHSVQEAIVYNYNLRKIKHLKISIVGEILFGALQLHSGLLWAGECLAKA